MPKIKKIITFAKDILADDSRTYARSPRHFTLKDWKSALQQTKTAMKSKRIGVLSAGVAYFLTLAVFPAIAASVAILSFALSGSQVKSVFQAIEDHLPSAIGDLITTQLQAALQHPTSGVLVIILGILIALFSLSGAVTNVISATNAIYEIEESRKFIKLRLTSLGFIIGAGVIALIVAGLLALNQNFLVTHGLPGFVAVSIIIVRWLIVAVLVAVSLSIFYRYAPDRKNPHWQWVTWGSGIATILWLIGTTAFFIYARYFAHFTQSYSFFAGIIVLMTWLNLTALTVLLGAQINYGLENQTRAKTTT